MAISIDTIDQLGLTAAGTTNPKKPELGQDAFLELMTTQLTHQDPTNPMENGDFLAQMAQFSTVEGIGELNTSFTEFANSITSGQALQAATLVGQSVLIPSNEGLMSLNDSLSGEVALNGRTNDLRVEFMDSNGAVVKTLHLGNQTEGQVAFAWDGLLDDGTYTDPGVYKIRAEAEIDGFNTVLETYVNAGVESVALGKGSAGVTLALAGLGEVSFNQVKKIF